MTRALFLGFALLVVACGDKSPVSICTNKVPPPAECKATCDSSPAAPNTCPAGFHCTPGGKCDAVCTASGNQCGDGATCTSDGQCMSTSCMGRQCDVADCASKGMPPTTITGTVFAPNGTLPLYGVSVYVPNTDVPAFTPGVTCGACANGLPGSPIVTATTDDKGNFSLEGVPSGANIPVVITIGKWRRQIKVASVASCATQTIDKADTRLPASHDDMTPNTTSPPDLPLIAISTGHADSLECLVRRLGIADKEITTDAQGGRIHLFSDTKATMTANGVGASSFDSTFVGGKGGLNDSQTLWGTAADAGKLKNYDIVILSCEGAQHAETKPQAAMDHLKAYADIGGRVFLSHWHNVWLEGGTQAGTGTKPAVWNTLATFDDKGADPGNGTKDTIDEDPLHNPKGVSFANWMLSVQKSSPLRAQVTLSDGPPATAKHTATMIDNAKAERWVYLQSGANQFPQNFQFSTPNEMPIENRCGKVVFSDMHVSDSPIVDGSKNVLPYPSSCASRPPPPADQLTDQEKALAFMFFDISSCVGVLF